MCDPTGVRSTHQIRKKSSTGCWAFFSFYFLDQHFFRLNRWKISKSFRYFFAFKSTFSLYFLRYSYAIFCLYQRLLLFNRKKKYKSLKSSFLQYVKFFLSSLQIRQHEDSSNQTFMLSTKYPLGCLPQEHPVFSPIPPMNWAFFCLSQSNISMTQNKKVSRFDELFIVLQFTFFEVF